MQTSSYPTKESRLIASRAVVGTAECQQQLGRVYRLILKYDPRKKAADQDTPSDLSQPAD
jgi:hypothetical protein